MLTSYELERWVRGTRQPLDPDDGGAPAVAASRLLGLAPLRSRDARRLDLAVRWGYGSLVGVPLVPLAARFGHARAAAAFDVAISGMAFVLLPLLARTPAPWRWPRDVILTSLGQHTVYVLGATAVNAAVGSAA